MANYYIKGGDGKEYGPSTDETIQQWIRENRIASYSEIKTEGGEFKRADSFPEFAAMFNQSGFAPESDSKVVPPEISCGSTRCDAVPEMTVNIGSCIGRGFDLVMRNIGMMVMMTFLFFIACVALNIPSYAGSFLEAGGKISGNTDMALPAAGLHLASFVLMLFLQGPLMGAFYLFLIKYIRGNAAGVSDIISEIQPKVTQIIICWVVTQVAILALMVLGFVAFGLLAYFGFGADFISAFKSSPPNISSDAVIGLIGGVLLAVAPAIYLSISYTFAIPLVADKGLPFWDAMELSRKTITQKWFSTFILFLLAGFIMMVGITCCLLPGLITFPAAMAAIMYLYEDTFGQSGS